MFRPACYLTDEWGCPSGEPIIGDSVLPANAALAQLEKKRMTSKTREKS